MSSATKIAFLKADEWLCQLGVSRSAAGLSLEWAGCDTASNPPPVAAAARTSRVRWRAFKGGSLSGILAMDDMELRRLADGYLLWRERGMTMWSYFRLSGQNTVPGSIFCAVLAMLFFWAGYNTVVVGISCFWVGMMFRDVQWAHGFVRGWPKVCELVNWEKVEQLAGVVSATK